MLEPSGEQNQEHRGGWRGFGIALTPRTFLIAAYAAIVGFFAGWVAVGLLKFIQLLTGFFFHGQWSGAKWTPLGNRLGFWEILIPVVGGVIAGLVIYYWEPAIKGHGIPEAMEAVLIKRSLVRGRVAILKPAATALVIGTGGPFGAEGPIIQTGGALGSLFGQALRLSAYDRRVLLAAGAGAGMAGTFLAPLTGIVVAIELIVLEFRATSFFPIAIACATGYGVSEHIRGSAPMFPMPRLELHSVEELWLFAILGVICGLVAWGMTLALSWIEDHFNRFPLQPAAVWAPTVGGFILGIFGYYFPRVLGTGYSTIDDILNGRIPALEALKLSLAKLWALVITLGSGTTGGVFAPSLMVGGGIGAAYAVMWRHWFPGVYFSSPQLYALAAMAAIFGGIARAPITAVVFLFELSRDAHAVAPLIVCVMLSDAVMRLLSENSMMTDKLAKRGLVVTQEYTAPLFHLWTTDIERVMKPLPEGFDFKASERDRSVIQASTGDSVAGTAQRMLELRARQALVMSRGAPPLALGVVQFSDILALEDEQVRHHDRQERKAA